MNLPDISSKLPEAVELPQAQRLRAFLCLVDERLPRPAEFTIYGSAAVAFYLADETDYECGYTADIDIGRMKPDSLQGVEPDADAVEPPLKLQTYEVTNWLLHPDWDSACIDVTDWLSTKRLAVQLLHPADLIVMKLQRGYARDVEDGIFLKDRYVESTEIVADRLCEACKYQALSNREIGQIEDGFEMIFERPVDLGRFRSGDF